jgi:hypothetical protein
MSLRFVAVLAALGALLALPASALGAYSAGPDVQIAGPESTAFDWTTQRCDDAQGDPDDHHIADLGARAFRDASGRQQLMMTHSSFPNTQGGADLGGARRLVGTSLNTVNVDCTQTMLSDRNMDPDTFNNHEWIASPYTTDGQKVYSTVYNEYYGWEDSTPTNPQCYQSTFAGECWYSGLTLATSTNQGDSFSTTNPLVAALPFKYQVPTGATNGLAVGYFANSNIVRNPRDGYYYTAFGALEPKAGQPGADVQQRGTCVMRTQNLGDPMSWRAWGNGDGNANTPDAFDVQFVNPYLTDPPDETRHVCKPVIPNIFMEDSLTYNRYFQRWMVTGYRHTQPTEPGYDGPGDIDVYYALSSSPNLSQWETTKLLVDADMIFTCDSGDTDPFLYPAALDHNSTSRNFETTGQSFHLYFTRYTQATCNGQTHRWEFPPDNPTASLDRDLVRVPVKLTRKSAADRTAAFEEGNVVDSDSGFDTASSSGGGFDLRTGGAYEGNNYVQATYLSGPNSPHGTINLPGWFNGTDVWYGSAFFVPAGFAAAHTNGTILEWSTPFGTSRGGINLGADHQWRLTHNANTLGSTFSLPEAQWISVEVHQKLESNAANGPISEMFVNGRLVSSSTAVNANPDTDGAAVFLKAGLVSLSGQPAALFVDRVSTNLVQRGALGAPATPGSFSGTEQSAFVTMYWLGSAPPGGGFRVYKQNPNGTWSLRFDNLTGNGVFETGLTNCTKYHYRVSAFDAQGRESIVSDPLELMPRGPGGCP